MVRPAKGREKRLATVLLVGEGSSRRVRQGRRGSAAALNGCARRERSRSRSQKRERKEGKKEGAQRLMKKTENEWMRREMGMGRVGLDRVV